MLFFHSDLYSHLRQVLSVWENKTKEQQSCQKQLKYIDFLLSWAKKLNGAISKRDRRLFPMTNPEGNTSENRGESFLEI